MRSQEVVMGDKKCGQSDSAVSAIKAMSGSYMEFVCAVKPFDDLFIESVLGRFIIEVL